MGSSDVAAFSWFLGAGVAFLVHWLLSRRAVADGTPVHRDPVEPGA
jgi:cytosine/uracil/thiamine/allantoin permease